MKFAFGVLCLVSSSNGGQAGFTFKGNKSDQLHPERPHV